MKNYYYIVLIHTLISLLHAEPTEERIWTSKAETKISARALSLENNTVTLRTPENRELKVSLDQLITTDQEFIRDYFLNQPLLAPPITLPDLPHPVGKTVGPIDTGDGSTYYLYLPTTLTTDTPAPLLFWVGPTGGKKNSIRHYIPAAELTGMVLAVSIEGRNQKNAFQINHEHTLKCLAHLQDTLPVSKKRILFAGISGGGATSLYNAARIKCDGAMPFVAYCPPDSHPNKKNFYYVIGGCRDFNRYHSALFTKEMKGQATHRLYPGGHGGPKAPLYHEGLYWLYTRALYQRASERKTEIARFESRFQNYLTNDLLPKSPHLVAFWANHLLETCQVEGKFADILKALQTKVSADPLNGKYVEGRKALEQFSLAHYAKEKFTSANTMEHTTTQIEEVAQEFIAKWSHVPEIKKIADELGQKTVSLRKR